MYSVESGQIIPNALYKVIGDKNVFTPIMNIIQVNFLGALMVLKSLFLLVMV
ncbi:hypothetical protein [Pedobacter jeongneungensis]|uniref:hypothetical protein n=1 Tax=Pedobacter jeongneungensis TaxID=947309 RepID=UPI0031E10220